MLFERLEVENLGVFRGKHSIDLAPADASRPIVLVGALNGSGKTTVIEALQLALYGRRAGYGWRGVDSYTEYLAQLRNRYAGAKEPTVVDLTIRLADGRRLRVRRQWTHISESPREYLEVFEGGNAQSDSELSEGWEDEIERLLPSKLSELFFFDGERIEELADPKKSASVLRTAISSLLGIDLVDSLLADLEIVRRNQKSKYLTALDRAEIVALDEEDGRLGEDLAMIEQSLGQLNNKHGRAVDRLQRAEQHLRSKGQDRLKKKDQLLAKQSALEVTMAESEEQLRELAAGPLAIAVARPFLARLRNTAANRASLTQGSDIVAVRQHSEQLKAWVNQRRYSKKTKAEIVSHLDQHLADLKKAAVTEHPVDYRSAAVRLASLLDVVIPGHIARATDLRNRIATAGRNLEQIEKKLGRLPAHGELAEAIKEQVIAEEALKTVQKDMDELAKSTSPLRYRRQQLSRKKEELLKKTVASDDAERVVSYCQRAKVTLSTFRANLVRQRRELLERLILEAFELLTRKDDLVQRLTIDAETMQARLYGLDGHEVLPEQLSAGERQLLAVAMLWGLAKASGRPVPVVIDTPLGRLDGEHRATLVQRYFPDASHQVILLSTDEEVDAKFSSSLGDSVTHRYLISYDPTAKSSTISTGYFTGH